MHREVRDRLEDILAGGHAGNSGVAWDKARHLDECAECRNNLAAMRDQQRLLRSLRLSEEVEPRAGFYARVIERIESQGAASIWSLFFDSPVGRGLAMASMVLALSVGVYLVSSERGAEPVGGGVLTAPDSGAMLTGSPDRDAVLVNLVTYREQ
jgi:predicted anti-sigma-YlaC factor YlaD